jgi:hypothetical protein
MKNKIKRGKKKKRKRNGGGEVLDSERQHLLQGREKI